MSIEIILLILLVLLSGFFSGIEAAFFSVSKLDIKRLVRKKVRYAKTLQKLKEDTHRFIITVLIGNNLVNIGATALATKIALDMFGSPGIAISTGVMTLVVLIGGEIIPKSFCAYYSRRVALFTAPIIDTLAKVLFPIISFFDFVTRGFLYLLGVKKTTKQTITEEAIKELAQISVQDGGINKNEHELISNVFEFDETIIREIMTPKETSEIVSINTPLEKVLELMNKTGFSRIPVYEKNRDTIVGVIHIKAIVDSLVNKKEANLRGLMSEPYFVPDQKKIKTLLSNFRKRQTHMAIVVNEYGSFVGIITIEDVLEELVGEIDDETDRDQHEPIVQISEGVYKVLGDCEIELLNEQLHTRLENDITFNTISGLILNKLGRIPKPQEKIDINSLRIIVTKATSSQIMELRVHKKGIRKSKNISQ
ncbi:MAG: hemolysin family protein [Candidatus Woesearchaeota archaeon]